MEHQSFIEIPATKERLIEKLESEFTTLVEQSIASGNISLPPLPDVVVKIQQLCLKNESAASDIAQYLLEDPGLSATILKVANSVIFNRRNVTCTDIAIAIRRLGILRVRDIVTAQAIEQLKHDTNLCSECNDILQKSATASRQLGATMALVVKEYQALQPEKYAYFECDKALLVGLLSDIGLFCLINQYHQFLNEGNYLDNQIAMHLFRTRCATISKLVLERWGFDNDFVEVAADEQLVASIEEVSYLDIARIANYLLMYRKHDENIDDLEIEFDVTGAEVIYNISTLSDKDFVSQLDFYLNATGL